MEWSDLQVFLAAVRAGSYTAAGRQLGINRTTVGRRVDALEAALGIALFEEGPLGPAPSRTGKRLLAAAEVMEREVAAMRSDLALPNLAQGPVRVAGSGGIVSEFLPEFAEFRRRHPEVSIELLGELDPIDAVTYRRADLAIALVRKAPLRLWGVELATLTQAPYARRNTTAQPAQLGWGFELDAALPGSQWTASNPAGETAEKAGLTTFNAWPAMKQAVLAGLGSATLWCFAADAEPDLERLAPPDPRHDCPLWLLHRAKAPPSPGLSALIAFLTEALRSRVTGPPAG